MAYVADAATDLSTPVAPAAVNQQSDATPPDVTPTPPAAVGGPVVGAAPATTPPPPQGNAPGAPIPKQSFREGAAAAGTPSYHTDSNGNVISNTPVRAPSAKGILGQILMGALEGASRGAAATTPEGATGKGGAFSAGAAAARKGAQEADDRARAIAQRNFENQQAATAAKVKTQMELAQTANITQNMNFAAEEHPGVMRAQQLANDSAELTLRGTHQKLLEDGIDFKKNMAALGIDPTSFTEHSPELTAQIKPLVAGASRAVHNGHTGEANGVDGYPKSLLAVPITTPVTYSTYDGALDKSGVPIPTPHVITPDGKLTADDYLNKYFAGQAQLVRLAQQTHADMTMQQQKATLGKEQAESAKDTAEAKLAQEQADNLAKINAAPPANFKPNPNAFSMSAPDLQKDLQQQGANVPGDFASLYGAAHYKIDPNAFPNRVTKGTGQMDRATALSYIRTYINPNYDESNFSAVKKMETEFANPDSTHAGGALIAFNTATAHLGALYDAASALKNGDFAALNKIANEYSVQVGQSPVLTFNAIRGALAGEIGKTFKGGAADIPEREDIQKSINAAYSAQVAQDVAKTYAHLMLSKVGSQVAHYTAYTGELPPESVQPAAAAVYAKMGIDPTSVLPTNAKISVGGTGNANPTQPAPAAAKPFTNRAGQSFTPDQNGQFVSGGWIWQVNPAGTGAKAIKPAPSQQ